MKHKPFVFSTAEALANTLRDSATSSLAKKIGEIARVILGRNRKQEEAKLFFETPVHPESFFLGIVAKIFLTTLFFLEKKTQLAQWVIKKSSKSLFFVAMLLTAGVGASIAARFLSLAIAGKQAELPLKSIAFIILVLFLSKMAEKYGSTSFLVKTARHAWRETKA